MYYLHCCCPSAYFLDQKFKLQYITDEDSIKEIVHSDRILIKNKTTLQSSPTTGCSPTNLLKENARYWILGSLLKSSESDNTQDYRKIVTPLRGSLKSDKVDMLVFVSKNV